MHSQTTNPVSQTRRPSLAHPFAPYEAALQSLLRRQAPIDPQSAQRLDQMIRELYETAVRTATSMCRHFDFRPYDERALEAVHEWICQLRPHAAKGYQPDRPLFPYAYIALKYIILGMARRERRAASVRIEVDSRDVWNDPAELAELLELKEVAGNLPEGLRNVVMLRYFEGHSANEIAVKLSVSRNAVNLRHFYAVERLRNYFN